MSTPDHSLARRVTPAVVLTGASVLGIFLLDRAAPTGRHLTAAGGPATTAGNTSLPPTTVSTPGNPGQPQPVGGPRGDEGGINPNAGGIDPSTTVPAPANPNCVGTTITGNTVDIADWRRTFGTVTVSIVKDKTGTVCDVTATYNVNDRRSMMIEQYSIPRLNASAVASKATSLQAISGATAICEAYAQSLQSALDATP